MNLSISNFNMKRSGFVWITCSGRFPFGNRHHSLPASECACLSATKSFDRLRNQAFVACESFPKEKVLRPWIALELLKLQKLLKNKNVCLLRKGEGLTKRR